MLSFSLYFQWLTQREENSEPKPELESEKLEKENNNIFRIVGIIDGHYIVQTPKGFKKPKVLN